MRDLNEMNQYRVREPAVKVFGWIGDDRSGAFQVPSPTDRAPMVVIASSDAGWDHVSVSRKNRCPNWGEMEYVKRMFFRNDETAMQLHVPPSDHVSMHPYVLHIWRPWDVEIPRPPAILVGVGNREARDPDDADAMMREAGF